MMSCSSSVVSICSASESGLRTLGSGSRAPKARSAATTMDVRDGCPGPNARDSGLLRIFVDTLSCFFAEAPRFDVFHEQRAGPVFLAQGLMKKVQYAEARVEAHQIDHFEGAHGMVQTELQRLVDIASARDALLQHVKGFIAA